MVQSLAALAVRIRSAKDLIVVLILAAAIAALQFILQRVFGMDQRKARRLSSVVVAVFAIIIAVIVALAD